MYSSYFKYNKLDRFNDLIESVQHCNLCSRLCVRRKVLSQSNGNIDSQVLFVAEAPGRLGAERTGVPLHGDRTGDNFEILLGNIGWKREEIFITNSILCNPQKENGTNGTPTTDEISNCSAYLEMVINLVNPCVIVTLGTTALDALSLISPHYVELKKGVAKIIHWRGIKLFPLYHPGPRAAIHRSLIKQRSDFILLAKIVHPKKGLLEKTKLSTIKDISSQKTPTSNLHQIVRTVVELGGKMTYFKLTKLLYMIDLLSLNKLGHTVACDLYIRQVDGPWPPKLNDAIKELEGYELHRFFVKRIPMIISGPSPRSVIHLDSTIMEIIIEVFQKYGALNNSDIKTAVYLTNPMRYILSEEKKGKDMRNKPVILKDRAGLDI